MSTVPQTRDDHAGHRSVLYNYSRLSKNNRSTIYTGANIDYMGGDGLAVPSRVLDKTGAQKCRKRQFETVPGI